MKDLPDISRFMEAGGTPSWAEWQEMSTETKAAFVAVARRQRVEGAIRTGKANSGPHGMLEVVAEIDNGQALEAALLSEAVTNAVR